MTTRIASKRLIMTPFSVSDIPAFAQLSTDPKVMQYVATSPQTYTDVHESVTYFLQHLAQYGYGVMTLFDKKGKNLVGFCGFNHQVVDDEEYVELGYRLLPEHWGNGYASEAAQTLLTHAFNELKLPELVSIIHPENMASIRVSQKIGMKLIKTTRHQGMVVEVYHQKNPNTP